ncbi:hypothetical protein [Denitrobaculum tricleocarpae]|nr:hypothetical protein [Denitrobaculum tricleocarpae]
MVTARSHSAPDNPTPNNPTPDNPKPGNAAPTDFLFPDGLAYSPAGC